MAPQRQYLSTDPKAGTPLVDHSAAPPAQPPAAAAAQRSAVGEGLHGALETLNPLPILSSLYHLTADEWGRAKNAADQGDYLGAITAIGRGAMPVQQLVTGMAKAQWDQAVKAREAFEQGRTSEAVGHAGAAVLPALGPTAAQIGEDAPNVGAARTVGRAIGMVGPMVVGAARGVDVPIGIRPSNPSEAAAIEFGQARGIPVDAGTATGNTVVRGTQWLAERTLGGSLVGGKARQAQAEGLTRVGTELANQTHPQPVTAEQSGGGVTAAVSKRAADMNADATAAYTRLRQLEQQQAQTISQTGGMQAPATSRAAFTKTPLAVDIAPTKAAMQSTYDALLRKKELVGNLMGDEARALTSLDALMRAPDMAPLSVADAALSDLKALSRVDQSFRRTAGQAAVTKTVASLDRAVIDAAKLADSFNKNTDVFDALMKGRAATVNKFKAIDVLDSLRQGGAEPVAVYKQLTANSDSAVNLLRKVQREAPQVLPQLGRAFLEGLLDKATAEGGFAKAQGLMADWQKLGPETKARLFGSPALVKDIDNFLLLAKRLAENPNPSGTAFTTLVSAQVLQAAADPVSALLTQIGGAGLTKVLHDPRAVRVLTNGMRISLNPSKAAQAAAAAQIGRALSIADVAPTAAGSPPNREEARSRD